jgi:HD-GYP domain-containing protein (c-di-GMP phosphodiesterase class II)
MNTPQAPADNVAVLHAARPAGRPRPADADPAGARQHLIEAVLAAAGAADGGTALADILRHAVALAGADAGAIYVRDDARTLRLAVARGPFAELCRAGEVAPPIPLYGADASEPDRAVVAGHAVRAGCCINRPYAAAGVAGRPVAVLGAPLQTAESGLLGVLQLVNDADADGRPRAFRAEVEPALAALAAAAAMHLESRQWRAREIAHFESIVDMITAAIDAKSPYTAAHCRRVPIIYQMLAEAAAASGDSRFAGLALTDEQYRQLRIAAWLHDCGKLATPEHVVDKATKLECVYDRLHEISVRLEVVKRDQELACLEASLRDPENAGDYRADHYARLRQLDDDYCFLSVVNRGEEAMTEPMIERVRAIASLRWRDQTGLSRPLLSEDEVMNLCIRRGTLNAAERRIINQHVEVSIAMLRELKFPKSLAQVLEIAGKHHEMIDGSGYPYGLTGDQMSLPARMLVIADIFEALTAGDRPYKKGKTLREALSLMAEMRDAGKIDPEIFDLFLTSRVWQTYADQHMDRDFRTGVDIAPLLARPPQGQAAARREAG